jgi:transposase
MDVMHRRVAGLDVHEAFVMVCVRVVEADGQITKGVQRYSTMTRDLLAMADWLAAAEVTHLAMESTGVFWKPIWNLLEDQFTILLVNARHVKQVPGRKRDVSDAEWLAQLLQHGLLRASFIPPEPLRELRDLTRHRATLLQDRTRVVNRIHKVLEDANIKLSAVVSDLMGVSGRAMLRAIIAGDDDPRQVANLAQRRLRAKVPQLEEALIGRVRAHHRLLLTTLVDQVTFLEQQIADYDGHIARLIAPFSAALTQLQTIPGVKGRIAQNLLAEIGPDMTVFPSAAHLASWAAVCPGHDETGGKQRSGKTRKGNRWLRAVLTQAAWAAARTKGTYAQAQFQRIVARRGKKRAIIAVAHTLLIAVYHILRDRVPYRDLGAHHFNRLAPHAMTRSLVKRLERLGYDVTLHPANNAA